MAVEGRKSAVESVDEHGLVTGPPKGTQDSPVEGTKRRAALDAALNKNYLYDIT